MLVLEGGSGKSNLPLVSGFSDPPWADKGTNGKEPFQGGSEEETIELPYWTSLKNQGVTARKQYITLWNLESLNGTLKP